jgi:thioredoxin-related protein
MIISLLFALSSFAALPDNALTTRLTGKTFTGEVSKGYHFNDKAPNLLQLDQARVQPTKIEKRKISFQLKNTNYDSASASLYICDDALTFCVNKRVELKAAKTESTTANTKTKHKITRNEHGFIADDLDAACKEAAKEHKLVLADFSARWCPGCVRLEKETFGTKEFKDATKNFVKVRLDYDRFETAPYKKKFGIQGIPSLVAMTPDQEEISRSVDYQPMPILKAFLKDASTNPTPITELTKRAEAGDKAENLRLGQRLYAAGRYADAVPYLEKAPQPPIELRDARVQAAKAAIKDDDASTKAAFQKTAREAIAEEPASTRSLIWRGMLLETLDLKDTETRKKIADEGTALADDLLAHHDKMMKAFAGDPIGEFTGFEKLYLASERADMIEAANLGDDITNAALKVVTKTGRELHIPLGKTGTNLRFLIFLVAAKEYDDAEALGRAMLKYDPGNPELERRLIKILNARKKYGDAIKVAKQALPNSFGKNEVWVVQQLAKAYVGDGAKKEARALIEATLARPDIDWSSMASEKKDLGETLKTME